MNLGRPPKNYKDTFDDLISKQLNDITNVEFATMPIEPPVERLVYIGSECKLSDLLFDKMYIQIKKMLKNFSFDLVVVRDTIITKKELKLFSRFDRLLRMAEDIRPRDINIFTESDNSNEITHVIENKKLVFHFTVSLGKEIYDANDAVSIYDLYYRPQIFVTSFIIYIEEVSSTVLYAFQLTPDGKIIKHFVVESFY
jgi:hypothetical protein